MINVTCNAYDITYHAEQHDLVRTSMQPLTCFLAIMIIQLHNVLSHMILIQDHVIHWKPRVYVRPWVPVKHQLIWLLLRGAVHLMVHGVLDCIKHVVPV